MLYNYFKTLGIQPVTKTRPKLYADDTAKRILAHLGLVESAAPAAPAVEVVDHPAGKNRILSMAELRAERAKASKTRRAV